MKADKQVTRNNDDRNKKVVDKEARPSASPALEHLPTSPSTVASREVREGGGKCNNEKRKCNQDK